LPRRKKHRADITPYDRPECNIYTTIAEFEGEDEKKIAKHGTLPAPRKEMRNAEN